MIKKKIMWFISRFFLLATLIFALFPLIQVLLNSFRSDREVKTMPLGLPKEWVFNNYKETWEIGGYYNAYLNTFFIAFCVIILVLILTGLGAYALSKLKFRLRGFFAGYFFFAISLPSFLYIVPDYFVLNKLGLIDTHFALIIVYTASQLPFNMLLLRTFLTGIPRELEEAGKIDGCNELQSFLRITLPIAKSMFMTIALLTLVFVWNEFLWSNTLITTDALKTVSTKYVIFTGQFGSNMARIYTASVLTILPIIILYLLLSRKFIEGMTSGSVKG